MQLNDHTFKLLHSFAKLKGGGGKTYKGTINVPHKPMDHGPTSGGSHLCGCDPPELLLAMLSGCYSPTLACGSDLTIE